MVPIRLRTSQQTQLELLGLLARFGANAVSVHHEVETASSRMTATADEEADERAGRWLNGGDVSVPVAASPLRKVFTNPRPKNPTTGF